jgi:hypothetical protein
MGFLFSDRGEFVATGFEEPVGVYEVNSGRAPGSSVSGLAAVAPAEPPRPCVGSKFIRFAG